MIQGGKAIHVDLRETIMSNQENAPTLSFREFLRTKSDEFGVGDRHRRRQEWLAALNNLQRQLREWLHQSDPEGLLDVEPYDVARTERKLGTYDAPALKIRLGPGEVGIVPMSREITTTVFDVATEPSTSLTAGAISFAGRVDVTDGSRKYNLYRQIRGGEDHWWIHDERDRLTELDSDSFERILQDLLS